MTTLATRDIMIRFPRLHTVEAGLRARVCWNGRRAANGDGIAQPGIEVDYTRPLSADIAIWPSGKLGYALGGWAQGAWAVGTAHLAPGPGFAGGPFAIGQWAQPGGYFEWRPGFALRNGVYTFGVVLVDSVGNVSASPVEIAIEIAAAPRPVTQLVAASVDADGRVRLTWTPSPDFAVEAA